MIANVTTGGAFKTLVSYLETGEHGLQDPRERVAWVECRNLPTRDAQTAACMMAATASLSVSGAKDCVYHLTISCDPGDPVDGETLRRIADRTIRDLGQEEYQALIFAHADRAHPHLHIVVNRVHPERHTLWRMWRDYPRIERSLRRQEQELGLRIVPGWNSAVVRTADGGLRVPDEHETGLKRVLPRPSPRRADAEFLRDATARAAPVLEQARSWAEVERGLTEEGLTLRAKGGGFIITDGERQVKASEVGRECSRHFLEKRFGRWPDYRARMAVAGIARTAAAPEVQRETMRPPEAEAPVRPQAPAEPDSPPAAAARTRCPEDRVSVRRRPQFGDAGHGIAELFDSTPSPVLERPAPVPQRADQPDRERDEDRPTVESPASEPRLDPVPAPALPSPAPAMPTPRQQPQRKPVAFRKQVQERAGPVLERAGSWEELERGLAEVGLSLREKGGGFVVTDGEREVKASEVGRAFSRFHLEKRLGHYPDSRAWGVVEEAAPLAPAPAVDPHPAATKPEQLALPVQEPAVQEGEQAQAAARFRLYDDGTTFGVQDRDRHVYFAETRERALAEVERANAIVRFYPNVVSMRHLREMDGAWRDARGLPRLPEPEGRRIIVPAPEGLADGLPPLPPIVRVQQEPPAAPTAAPRERPPQPIGQPPSARPVELPLPASPTVRPEEPRAPASSPERTVEPPPVHRPARRPEPPAPIRKKARPLTERERYRAVLAAFKDELAALYRDPRAARLAFTASVAEIGPNAAASTLESDPERFGRLRWGARRQRTAEAARWGELYARLQTEGTRAYALHASALFRRASAVAEADAGLRDARSAANDVYGRPSFLATRKREAEDAERNVTRWLREIYDDPAPAHGRIAAYWNTHGRAAMEAALREAPEQFGSLRAGKRRLLVLRDTKEARWRAKDYAGWLGGAFKTIANRPTREEHDHADQAVRAAETRVEAAQAARDTLGPDSAKALVHDGLLSLQVADRGSADRARQQNRQVRSMLPASTLQFVRTLRDEILRDQERAYAREQHRSRGTSPDFD